MLISSSVGKRPSKGLCDKLKIKTKKTALNFIKLGIHVIFFKYKRCNEIVPRPEHSKSGFRFGKKSNSSIQLSLSENDILYKCMYNKNRSNQNNKFLNVNAPTNHNTVDN